MPHVARVLALLLCACVLPVDAGSVPPDTRAPAPFVLALLSSASTDSVRTIAPAQEDARLPLANAGANRSALVGRPIFVDGSASHDPGGRRIVFEWAIVEAPAGSLATLDASDPTPVLVPDVPGLYRLHHSSSTREASRASRPA
jgi:hypothetical protein